jgi:hypothetical protein
VSTESIKINHYVITSTVHYILLTHLLIPTHIIPYVLTQCLVSSRITGTEQLNSAVAGERLVCVLALLYRTENVTVQYSYN